MRRLVAATAPLDVASARVVLFSFLVARQAGDVVGLRFADEVDELAPDAVASCDDDLAWLGIDIVAEPLRASARRELYRERARQLVASGHAVASGAKTTLRVDAGETCLDDAVHGRVTFENHALGEIVLVHADGSVNSTFGAAVDDVLFENPLVVRDDRQLERSARAALIAAALGSRPPRTAHLGAIVPDAQGAALPTISYLRRAGFLPGAVIEHLAALSWSPQVPGSGLSLPVLIAKFTFERVSHGAAHLNEPQLRARNATALRALPAAELHALLSAAMQRAGLLEDPIPAAARTWIDTFLRAYGTQFTTLGEALALVADLRAEAVLVPAIELEKLRNRQVVFYLDAVGQYVDAQAELRDLPLTNDLAAIAQEFGIGGDDAFAAVRMALTGKHDGAPLALVFPLLGHDRILIRIGAISSHLLHGRGLEPIPFGPGGQPFETIASQRPPAT